MARKIEPRPDPQTSAAGDSPAAEQLAELVPNLSITVAGRDLVIREYGAFEGLEVAAQASAFMDDMVALGRAGDLTWTRVRRLLGKHPDATLAIAARAADVEPEWVRGLGRADLDLFLSSWFGVNAGFFVHEVVAAMQDAMMQAALSKAGTTSSSASPTPASATSTGSDA